MTILLDRTNDVAAIVFALTGIGAKPLGKEIVLFGPWLRLALSP